MSNASGLVFEKIVEGEWLRPLMKGYMVACCSCGMVHKLDFKILDERVLFRAFIDRKATAAKRRSKKRNQKESAK